MWHFALQLTKKTLTRKKIYIIKANDVPHDGEDIKLPFEAYPYDYDKLLLEHIQMM